MSVYKVAIDKIIKTDGSGIERTEIWAEINDLKTGQTEKKLIWWQDEDGVFHDETPSLPSNIRDEVDNAWIEKRREW